MGKAAKDRPKLLVITSAPGRLEDGAVRLDRKFAEGMRRYSESWPGPVTALLRQKGTPQLFSDRFDPSELPFSVELRPVGHRIDASDLDNADVVLASGDNADYLHVAALGAETGKAVFYTIEYIPETRRQILALDRSRSALSRARGLWHIAVQERRRRRAFALARGLQANGYPAAEHYRPVNANIATYLDNRIDAELLATSDEMSARRTYLTAGGPLRLIHSGRLEPMKGSQDLVPIAQRLAAAGVDFVLDVFGAGSLENEIRNAAAAEGIADRVRLHGVVDFATKLVPFARTSSDIYLSCHRQSDPSCSYLENMGCGLAVAGYDNRMWSALSRDSDTGWVAPLGDVNALARTIAAAASDRALIADHCDRARNFAAAHLFDAEFDKRVDQMTAAITETTH